MVKKSETALSGMQAIADYANRSTVTILSWVRSKGFPAKKIDGIWESTTEKVDAWKDKQIEEGV